MESDYWFFYFFTIPLCKKKVVVSDYLLKKPNKPNFLIIDDATKTI